MERSSSKAQHKSATRNTKSENNRISKAVEREAGGQGETSAQGLYDRFPPGLSVQQELTEAFSQELTWVAEGREDEESQQMGGTRYQRQQVAQDSADAKERKLRLPIPGSLMEGYRKLPEAMEADWERRPVNELRCRLCPHPRFSTWEDSSGTATRPGYTPGKFTSVTTAETTSDGVTPS